MPLAPCLLRRLGLIAALVTLTACVGDDGIGTGAPIDTKLTLRVSPKADSLGVGMTTQLSARVTDGAGLQQSATVAWMSLNSTIATVSATGLVTALATGQVGVVATIGSAADTASIYVQAGELVVEPNAVITDVGEKLQFSATTRSGAQASGRVLTWTSSDPAIATVDASGNVTAIGAGDVTVLASAGSQTGSAVMTVRQKDIASIRVAPTSSSLNAGTTEQLAVTAYDDAGRVMAVPTGTKWTSSNTTALVIDDDGLATGKSAGSAVVSVRLGPKTATASVNVLPIPVATVTLTLASSTLDVGQTTSATAVLKDASGNTLTGRTIAYQSSNPALATVNASGIVSAIAKGSVTITAIAEGKTGTAPLTVAAKTVATVAVNPNPASATVGQTAQLSATAADAQGAAMTGKTFTWSSSAPTVATVTASGLVTAVAAGTATITATTDGIAGQSSFTATAVTAASVSVSPTSSSLQVSGTTQLTATVYDAAGNVLPSRVPTWSSANPTVATVSSTGRVTAVSQGNTTITATVDGTSANAAIAVAAPPQAPVATVSVSLAAQTLNVGQSTQASAVLRDAAGVVLSNRSITWSSAAPQLATVSSSGVVTAIAPGSATIIATSEGQSGSATLVVSTTAPAPVATVTLSAASTSIYPGQSLAIVVTLKDAQGNTLTGRTIAWSSSSPSVLTVSPTGQVQAMAAGTATVTATSEGKSGSIAITVMASPVIPVTSVSVTAPTTTLVVGQTTQLTATPKDGHGLPLTGRVVTWSSSAPNVASVSSTGVVTAIAAGSVVINATVEGVVGSLPMAVTTTATTVASVSVTLASGALTVAQTTQATAVAKDASGNTLSAGTPTWASSNPAVATVSSSGLVTAAGAGSATITATISGKSGGASVSVTSTSTGPITVTPPAVPLSEPSPVVPAPTGRTIRVAAGSDLQAALNSALPGDVVALASGATFVGNFTLPAKACNGWVTIRTDIPDSDLPAAGQRITPAYAGKLAKIMTDNNQPALNAAMPTCQWRLFGVEIAVHPQFTGLQYWLMALGDGGWTGGGEKQTSLDRVPTDIVIDRTYIHGQTSSNLIRCLAMNSARTSVVNSYIDQCHAKGFDSQAIEGWNGPGPYLIENNFIAGAGENIMFGGADPGIYGLIPSDITIRRNHIYKDPAWKGLWTVKNLFELKNAKRVMIEGNIFENNWADAQAGMAIVIKSSHDACGTCTWQGSQDITFRYNIVRNSPRGFNLQAVDGESDNHVARVRAEHNLFENIGTFNGTGGDGWLLLLTHDLKDVTIAHNTFVHNVTGFGITSMMDYSNGTARNISIRDNVFTNPAGYSVMYSGMQVGSKSLTAFAGTSWAFDKNVVIGVAPDFIAWHPSASYYPATVGEVGFVSTSDYRLGSGSPFKGKATDGTDPGPDFATLMQKTAGVR